MLPTESSPLQRQAPSLQHRAKRAPGAVLVVAVAACGVLALRAATYRIPPAPSGATAAFTATSAPAASSERHDASEFAASSGHVTDYASFDGVYCGTETMALSCAAAITVHNTQLRWTDKLQLAVRFTVRSAGVAPTPIWSEALEVARVDAKNTASYAREIHLFRLRPGTTYDAVLCAMLKPTDDGSAAADDDYNVDSNSSTVIGCSANVTFVSAKTGYEFLDNAPIAEISGSPGFGVLAFDLNHALPAGAASGQSSFQGLVMVDTEGYVVWYHDAGAQVLAFDVFPFTHDVAMNVVLGGSRSSLAVLRPNGNARLVYEQTCGDDPLPTGWSQLNHECRLTRAGDGLITNLMTVVRSRAAETTAHAGAAGGADATGNGAAPDGAAPQRRRPLAVDDDLDDDDVPMYLGLPMSYYFNDQVAVWTPANNSLQAFASVAEYANPVSFFLEEPESMEYMGGKKCAEGAGNISVLDWSHASAIYEAESTFVVSLRNLDSVVAFYKGHEGGVAWSLSAHGNVLPSTIRFSNFENERFYDPHDAQLLDEDPVANTAQLLLLDDGDDRPGCNASGFLRSSGCYTRAVRYTLNFTEMTATLAWQFEFVQEFSPAHDYAQLEADDIFVSDGGSVTPFDGGVVFVALTVTEQNQKKYSPFAWIFEVDANDAGKVRSQVKVARELWSYSESGLYRAVPYSSVAGEGLTSPLG